MKTHEPVVFHYFDYVKYLRDSYEARHSANRWFSYRYIQTKTGLDPGFLFKVFTGKKRLPAGSIPSIVGLPGLNQKEEEEGAWRINRSSICLITMETGPDMRSGSTGSSPSRAASRGAKGNNGALFLLGEAIQVGCAVYLLDDVDVGRDRSEMVFGTLFSLTSILTHIANINDAIDATREYNSGQTKKEITLFVDSLGNPPPGYSE